MEEHILAELAKLGVETGSGGVIVTPLQGGGVTLTELGDATGPILAYFRTSTDYTVEVDRVAVTADGDEDLTAIWIIEIRAAA